MGSQRFSPSVRLKHRKMDDLKAKILNIILLGLTFCLLFTGFNTMSQTQKLVYSYASEQSSFNVDGFTTSAMIYVLFAFNSWLSPSIVVVFGAQRSLIAAALIYVFYVSQYLYLNTYSVYVATVLVGLAAPVIWTAQGFILTNNSDPETIAMGGKADGKLPADTERFLDSVHHPQHVDVLHHDVLHGAQPISLVGSILGQDWLHYGIWRQQDSASFYQRDYCCCWRSGWRSCLRLLRFPDNQVGQTSNSSVGLPPHSRLVCLDV